MSDREEQLDNNTSNRGAFLRLFSDYRYYWIAFSVILIDQIVKMSVKFSLNPYDEVPVGGDVFSINFIENKGAAFGLTIADILRKVGIDLSETSAKLILTLFSIFAIVVIVYLLRKVRHHKSGLPFFMALILGGAVGNIIDRVFYGVWFAGMNDYEGGLLYGRVVDMFYFDLYHGPFLGIEMDLLPVFNIADLAITLGIVSIILFQRRFFRQHMERSGTANASTETASESAQQVVSSGPEEGAARQNTPPPSLE